nr:MAG TPA: hypothetical protein [Caudoviricetes sp.]
MSNPNESSCDRTLFSKESDFVFYFLLLRNGY